jgi:hypothetical protein
VIQHALVAIGSMHEYQTVGNTSSRVFALEQYNMAIRKLLTPTLEDGKQAIDICLISAILFTCFEVRDIEKAHCWFSDLPRVEYPRPS